MLNLVKEYIIYRTETSFFLYGLYIQANNLHFEKILKNTLYCTNIYELVLTDFSFLNPIQNPMKSTEIIFTLKLFSRNTDKHFKCISNSNSRGT